MNLVQKILNLMTHRLLYRLIQFSMYQRGDDKNVGSEREFVEAQ